MTTNWRKMFPDAKRSKIDFLIDGTQYFESVAAMIEKATGPSHYIYILGWMLDLDFPLVQADKSRTLFELLKNASARGVEIRILIWGNPFYLGSAAKVVSQLSSLPNTEVFVDEETYAPPKARKLLDQLTPYVLDMVRRYGLLAQHYSTYVRAMISQLIITLSQKRIGAHHEKLVIIKCKESDQDKLVAFCGGIDFNTNRIKSTSEINGKDLAIPGYHDTACRVEGIGAYDILQRFKKRWLNHRNAKKKSLRGENEQYPGERLAPSPHVKVVGTYNRYDSRAKDKDRSLKRAYFAIIKAAKNYIYIEDQYLVNRGVAKELNKKLKEKNFKKLTFAIQDARATSDILVPNRKRHEFFTDLLTGLTDEQRKKILVAVFDRENWEKDKYHVGMHAKTLIVDDEIAIIGSANVNLRSFTLDSETSVIVFDDNQNQTNNFARIFRIKTWEHYQRKAAPREYFESWDQFHALLDQGIKDFILIKYEKETEIDKDEWLIHQIQSPSVNALTLGGSIGIIGSITGTGSLQQDIQNVQTVLHPDSIRRFFDIFWDCVIDPDADSSFDQYYPNAMPAGWKIQ